MYYKFGILNHYPNYSVNRNIFYVLNVQVHTKNDREIYFSDMPHIWKQSSTSANHKVKRTD